MKRNRVEAYIITGVISVAAGILLASFLYSRERSRDPLRTAEKIIKECRSKIEEIERDLASAGPAES